MSTEESNKETTKVYSEIYNTIRESTEAIFDNQDKSLPGLVLSVIGDSESYVPKSWNTAEFESGLLQTVKGAKGKQIITHCNVGSFKVIQTSVKQLFNAYVYPFFFILWHFDLSGLIVKYIKINAYLRS